MHHVGYVVADISESAPGFASSIGASWDEIVFNDPRQGVNVTFFRTEKEGPSVELVAPASQNSPVTRFLAERGGGLHHLCYEVEDLEGELAAIRSRGAMIASRPKPAVAFRGRRIAWVITAERLLVELLETRLAGQDQL